MNKEMNKEQVLAEEIRVSEMILEHITKYSSDMIGEFGCFGGTREIAGNLIYDITCEHDGYRKILDINEVSIMSVCNNDRLVCYVALEIEDENNEPMLIDYSFILS